MADFDDNGWLVGTASAMRVGDCYSLLVPEPSAAMPIERWSHQAARFFKLSIELEPPKRYPGGGFPIVDRATLRIGRDDGDRSRVELLTLPLDRAPEVKQAALDAALRIGAGMDTLVARATRLWQVTPIDPPHPALAASALLASLLLGPVLPPSADTVFGVKTARERLEALGSW